MSTERDYYSILQINRNADQEAIERAYQRLAQVYDPATSNKPKAAARFREITEAYDALSDRKQRAEYDRQLAKRRAGELAAGSGSPADVLSNRYVWLGATGVIGAIVLALVLVLVVGGGGGEKLAVAQPTVSASVTAGTPTPVGQTPGPTAPGSPPAVTGETVTTPSGLKYIDIVEGTGASPVPSDVVRVNYTGWVAADGKKFDSSYDRGKPLDFGVSGVIAGWTEGLQTMKEGGKRRLIIPSALAYGAAGQSRAGIGPNADLIFDVELIQVNPPTPAPAPAATVTAHATPTSSP